MKLLSCLFKRRASLAPAPPVVMPCDHDDWVHLRASILWLQRVAIQNDRVPTRVFAGIRQWSVMEPGFKRHCTEPDLGNTGTFISGLRVIRVLEADFLEVI